MDDALRVATTLCQHRLVRTALVGVLLLALIPMPANGQVEPESVSFLVRADGVASAMASRSPQPNSVEWRRVVVPVEGTLEATAESLRKLLHTDVVLERSYPLLGGESEPLFGEQWALENTGQAGGVPNADIDVERAWTSATGQGVVVAVIDSGVEAGHSELAGQLWSNQRELVNGLDDDGNGLVDDVDGWDFESDDNDPRPDGTSFDDSHGTLIAGVIAAAVDGAGISGVAPDSQVMNLRACDNGSCMTLDAIEAIHYAVDNGAHILNLSFGGPSPLNADEPLSEAIDYARQHDVLVVTAAGNAPPGALPPGMGILPAELPQSNNVAVAASNRLDRLADFSYYGPNIDIAAPGVDLLTTDITGYSTVSGTSFSAPIVAGVAALLLSDDPGIHHQELVARLMAWTDSPSGIAGMVESGRVNAGDLLSHRFTDTLGDTFYSDIEWAAERGLTQGCNPPDNTEFCTDDPVTRGQMAAFIRRYLKLPAATRDHFTDDDGSTFEEDINRLAEAGITKGCNPPVNDRFCPEDATTREQMAAFLVRALGLSEDDHAGFVDVPANNIFSTDIRKLATAGITRGCDPPLNSLYCPGDEVTRAQMTAFLQRASGP